MPSRPNATGTWKNLPIGVRIVVALAAAGLVTLAGFLINNPDFLHRFTGNGFKVGDCATVAAAGLSGAKMDHADCPHGHGTGLDPIYRVDNVLDGKDGRCPGSHWGVTFSNEPENVTYCLTSVGLT
jgi:hypothetical protein